MKEVITQVTEVTKEEVERAEFTLKLPDELSNIKPKWTVDLPKQRELHIFEKTRPSSQDENKSVTIYDCYLVSRKSGRIVAGPSIGHNNFYNGHVQYSDLQSVKYGIFELVARLSVKKRTRTNTEVDELED